MPQLRQLFRSLDCDVRFDALTRQLYATDASLYQVQPRAVAFPKSAQEAASLIAATSAVQVPITPRGAGSGLAGGALGDGLIVEFARFNRQISHLDLGQQTVRVGAGVVLDQLNAFLKPHGFCFGPDVATSSRATLGGMIANNSSGARTPFYGTTADHVRSLEIILADGRRAVAGPVSEGLSSQHDAVARLVAEHASEIRTRMPAGLLKRWPGYGLDRFLRQPTLANILSGSEGTLAAITSAELKIVPLPREKGIGLIFFDSVGEAMQATVELLALRPAAIEHIDRVLTDQTKGQWQFQRARDLLGLDQQPCESILIVEFYEDVAERLAALERKNLGLRRRLLRSAEEMNLVWALRKAGVALLTGCRGPAKPITCIEDTAVRPEQLPEYVQAIRSILRPLNVEACFYGHAASGLLHVRPVLDLHQSDGRRKLRHISNEISALVRQFNGSLAAEHGVGMARTEFLRDHLGEALLNVHRQIKRAFDPGDAFNPGKILDTRGFRIDDHLRLDVDSEIQLPFEPRLAFAGKDGSFLGNLEQCNGCGGCRKEAPVMCPTFLATREEIMSTRGRANMIRASLNGSMPGDGLDSPELAVALDHCLSCKACTTECPSNVNLSLLKAELLHARHRRDGLPLRARFLSSIDLLGKIALLAPRLVNGLQESSWFRSLLFEMFGLSPRRDLPRFARERFDHWAVRRDRVAAGSRGPIILWDDCFARYYHPQVGKAAVRVLEAAGYEVILVTNRQCCGRPAFSQGNLDEAARLGRENLALLSELSAAGAWPRAGREAASGAVREKLADDQLPIVFLEPSCYSMFAEDYEELRLPKAKAAARRSVLFEDFVEALLKKEPDALPFAQLSGHLAIHAHCHSKALGRAQSSLDLARRLPGRSAVLLDTGCCGMAGAFGMIESKYDLSIQIGEQMAEKIRGQPAQATLVASGTSCRQQIEHLLSRPAYHMAEVLAAALPP